MPEPVSLILETAVWFVRLLRWAVMAHVVMSWVGLLGVYLYVRPFETAMRSLYAPVRRVLPTTAAGLDFAPIVVFMALVGAEAFLLSLA